jgi:hypothetical protein
MEVLLKPERLWSREEIFAKPCPIPKSAGIYAWYFQRMPSKVPVAECVRWGDYVLLYAGIAPKAPPRNGRPPSTQTLFDRIRYHLRGNAEGSTLRLTLGCLLAADLGIELRRVGSGNRFTFACGEKILSDWMATNARVVWHACTEPWLVEPLLIQGVPLPLNRAMNAQHAFCAELGRIRKAAKERAKGLPVLQC